MNFPTFMPGTMSAPTGVSPGQQAAAATKTRDNMLCRRCRHDKQKCLPQIRNWEAGEKCKRCLDRGYECSALEKAPYRPRKRRTPSNTSPSYTAARPSTAHERSASMQNLTPNGPQPTYGSSRSRPVTAWEAEFESMPSELTQYSISQSSIEGTATSARKLSEHDARVILAKLGDLHATRELLRADLKLCDQVEAWLGTSPGIDKIREAITAVVAAIEAEFWACSREAEPFTKGKDIGPFKEAFVAKLGFIRYRFRVPPPAELIDSTSGHNIMDDIDDDDVQEKLHELHKRKRIWSAADYLVGNASGRKSSRHPVHAHSENEVVFCFMKASEGIKDVFSEIVLENADHRQILHIGFGQVKDAISAFPACHLAVAEASAHVLLNLWKRVSTALWEVDYLARTPVHSAAYAGKIQGLQSIFSNYPTGISNTGCDAFGLTPLHIAACRDDLQTFVKLSNGKAYLNNFTPSICDKNGLPMSVLALAARNGSTKVVQYIIRDPSLSMFQQGAFLQSGSSELCQALLNNQVDVANILISHHSEQYDLTDQVPAAKQVAVQKGLDDIVARLNGLVPTRQDAIHSLNDITWDGFIDYDAFADASAQYDSSQASVLHGFDVDTPYWSSQGSNVSSMTPFGIQSPETPNSRSSNGFRLTSSSGKGQHGSNAMRAL